MSTERYTYDFFNNSLKSEKAGLDSTYVHTGTKEHN